MNSAIAQASDPVAMATAMRLATESALYYKKAKVNFSKDR